MSNIEVRRDDDGGAILSFRGTENGAGRSVMAELYVAPSELPNLVSGLQSIIMQSSQMSAIAERKEDSPFEGVLSISKLNALLEDAMEPEDRDELEFSSEDETPAPAPTVQERPTWSTSQVMGLRAKKCECSHFGKEHKRFIDNCNRCGCDYFRQ